MTRWITLVVLACVIGVGACEYSPRAGASSDVAGLGPCAFNSGCDLAVLRDRFPDYHRVCSLEVCAMVAAADWERVATGVFPSPDSLAAAFKSSSRSREPGTGLGPLWRYWSASGLAGEVLTGRVAVGTSEAAVEDAITLGSGVIAVDSTAAPARVGAAHVPAGTVDLVAAGFTPKGPLVVLRHTIEQMTWGQWDSQVRAAWLPTVAPSSRDSAAAVSLTVSPPSVPAVGGSVVLHFAARGASGCSISSAPDLWWTASVAVPCVGSHRVVIGSSSTGQTWTISFTADEGAGVTVTDPEFLSQSAQPPPGPLPTAIWSGLYEPSSSTAFTSVSGQFVVPTINCSAIPSGVVSVWDGLGGRNWSTGAGSGSLLQTGVISLCLGGAQNNFGWWELWPSTLNIEVNYYNFPVSAGDTMQPSVFQLADGRWETQLNDVNTGLSAVMVTGDAWGVGPTTSGAIAFSPQGSAATVAYSGGRTAEWIVEDPLNSLTGSGETFANYGSVSFSDLGASPLPVTLTPSGELAIVQRGATLSAPTSLSADGFTTSYTGP